jgi:hypothetical protein
MTTCDAASGDVAHNNEQGGRLSGQAPARASVPANYTARAREAREERASSGRERERERERSRCPFYRRGRGEMRGRQGGKNGRPTI